MPDSNPNPYAALKLKEFRWFVIGRFCATTAIQIQAVVVGWQVYKMLIDARTAIASGFMEQFIGFGSDKSAAMALGLIGLAEAIPAITVSLMRGMLLILFQEKK